MTFCSDSLLNKKEIGKENEQGPVLCSIDQVLINLGLSFIISRAAFDCSYSVILSGVPWKTKPGSFNSFSAWLKPGFPCS